MSRKKKVLLIVVLVAVVGTLAAVNLTRKSKAGVAVTLEGVAREDVVNRVSCRGRIQARRKVDLSANVMGQIVNLAVREGDRVEKDQFLLQIDQVQLQAQASGSQAALAALLAERDASRANALHAQSEFERAEKNHRNRILADADFERARAARDAARASLAAVERRIEQARAQLEASRDTLAKTTIRAPMAGLVTALPVEEGEIAVIGTMNNPGTRLLTISDMSEVEAEMAVDETDVPKLRLGQPARVRLDAFADGSFQATVSEIASSPMTRSASGGQAVEFSVKLALKDPPEGVRPGFSVSADIETGRREKVLAIPVQALVVEDLADRVKEQGSAEDEQGLAAPVKAVRREDKDQEGVYRLEDGKARFVPIETGIQGELKVEVLEGLEEGARVITGPFRILRTLRDGDRVREAKPDKKKGSG